MYSDVRLEGKVAIVTGANSGIGLETARELARRGARVILACRSEVRGREARDDVIEDTKNQDVHSRVLDLANLSSVRKFSNDFNKSESRLDLLVNNAGVFTFERRITEDGLELDFGVNHIGHFLLTNLLLDKLKLSAPSRVVTVSSKAHEYSDLNFDDLQTTQRWTPMKAYGRSKAANVLFAAHLAKILQGTGVTSYCLHPGVIATDLGREFEGTCLMTSFRCLYQCFRGGMTSPADGAKTTLYCCLEPSLAQQSGLYYSNCKPARAKSYATNSRSAELLWNLSLQLVQHLETNTSHFNSTSSIAHQTTIETKHTTPSIPLHVSAKTCDVILSMSAEGSEASQDEPDIIRDTVAISQLEESKLAGDGMVRVPLLCSSVAGARDLPPGQAVGVPHQDTGTRAR